jgi:hypothetical protein
MPPTNYLCSRSPCFFFCSEAEAPDKWTPIPAPPLAPAGFSHWHRDRHRTREIERGRGSERGTRDFIRLCAFPGLVGTAGDETTGRGPKKRPECCFITAAVLRWQLGGRSYVPTRRAGMGNVSRVLTRTHLRSGVYESGKRLDFFKPK